MCVFAVYVDGVSLTYGTPCKHLFTYASGHSSDSNFNGNCLCAKHPGDKPPKIIITVNPEVPGVQHMVQFTLY